MPELLTWSMLSRQVEVASEATSLQTLRALRETHLPDGGAKEALRTYALAHADEDVSRDVLLALIPIGASEPAVSARNEAVETPIVHEEIIIARQESAFDRLKRWFGGNWGDHD